MPRRRRADDAGTEGALQGALERCRCTHGKPVHPFAPWACFLSGVVAITINTILLQWGTHRGWELGNGVLLRFMQPIVSPVLVHSGFSAWWMDASLPSPTGASFKVGFHVVVGLLMAVFYAAFERYVRLGPVAKGFIYAAAIYVVNAGVLFPMLGDGFAGYRIMTATGLIYFAFAHTAFFVLNAWLYEKLRPHASVAATR